MTMTVWETIMKRVNVFVIAALLGFANVAGATNPVVDDSIHNSATGGSATANGGRSDSDATAVNQTDVDVRNSANSGSFSGASSNQKQSQGQGQDQAQGISAFNGNTTTVEAPDVKGMGKELAKHASSAAEVRSDSKTGDSPCGDSTGLSAQAGLGGAGFATTSETCKAFRLQRLEAGDPAAVSTTLAEITYFVGWLPRTVLHVASFGVLN